MDNILSFQNLYYKWWKNLDKFIFTLIILLFFIGLFFSLVSTSLIVSDKLNTNDYLFFFKHLIFIFLDIFNFYFLINKSRKIIYDFINYFFISLIFLFLVPVIGIEVKGSKDGSIYNFYPDPNQ